MKLSAVVVCVVFAAGSAGSGRAQGPVGRDAVIALSQVLELERELLQAAQLERLDNLESQRTVATAVGASAGELAASLRRAAAARSDADRTTVIAELAAADESLASRTLELESLVAAGRDIARRIAAHAVRVRALESRVAELRAATPDLGELEGTWDVTTESGDAGVFLLRQEGTLITGQYRFASGRSGSLTGTYVNGRVELKQVDSRYGRDVTYFGQYSGSDDALRGQWEAQNLGTGQPAFGSWRAEKRPVDGDAEAEAPEPGAEQEP